MAGRDLTDIEQHNLETLIDECGLCAVLQSLSTICGEKADHIEQSYSDQTLARAWRCAEGKLGLVSCDATITKVGQP